MMDIDVDSPIAKTRSSVKRGSLSPDSPHTSSNTKRIKLQVPQDQLASLNVKMNTLSEEGMWHKRLENSTSDPRRMTSLLLSISMHLSSELAKTGAKANVISPLNVDEAASFVEGFNPKERKEWEAGINKCLQGRDWGELITHPKLKKPVVTQNVPQLAIEFALTTTEEQAVQLHIAFLRPYHGDFDKVFLCALDDYEAIYNPKRHFGRCIPIIQSSATGKSRMVREIGKNVPTLSICFRESALPTSGWPPNDEPARHFLLRQRPDMDRYKGEELAAAFLGAVMDVVADTIEARGDDCPSPEEDWMYDWHLDCPINIVDSSRHTYLTEVEAKAEKLLLDNRETVVTARVSYNIQDIAVNSAIPLWHKRLFSIFCHPSFAKLSRILKKRNVKYFILAIDECSDLDHNIPVPFYGEKPNRVPLWCMSLIALQRIIKAYDDFVSEVPFWFLLLDTSSSEIYMALLGSDAPLDSFEKGYRSLPVWSNVGFNQMAQKDVFAPANRRLPTYAHSMQHLKRFGRPYWATLTNDEVLGVASEKLFSDVGFRPNQEDHVFAAFAVRVGLELGAGKASKLLAMESVRSHMRILEAVVDSMIVTSAPSEPILAIAAAMELNDSDAMYRTALETLLNGLILKGVVRDQGLLGELSSWLLLLRARDKAADQYLDIDPISKLRSVRPVQLSKFLQTLLGDTLGISDEKGESRNKLLKEASFVWINFTHFYQMPVFIGEVTESMLIGAWSTGAAFQGVHLQPVIDGFIVGYRGSLDEPFKSSQLITIPWKVKTKSGAAGEALVSSLTAPFIVPQNGVRYKPWHVIIVMDLAAPSIFGKASGPRCDLMWDKAVRPSTGVGGGINWKSYAEENESEGQRYCLIVRGHRAVNYPVLKGLERQFNTLFNRLLRCGEPELMPYAERMVKATERMMMD